MKLHINGIEYIVEYSYSPATQGVHTLSNGDPGYPDEPAVVDFLQVIEVSETGELNDLNIDGLTEILIEQIVSEIIGFEESRRDKFLSEQYEYECEDRV